MSAQNETSRATNVTKTLDDMMKVWHESIENVYNEKKKLVGFKEDYSALDKALADLPTKLKHKIMVPFSPVAFFHGEIVHSNEITVLLGENYFLKQTAPQAREIISRRIKYLDESVSKLDHQLQQFDSRLALQEQLNQQSQVTGNDDGEVVDIREDYVSDEDEYEDEDELEEELGNKITLMRVNRRDPSQDEDDEEEKERAKYLRRLMELEEEEEKFNQTEQQAIQSAPQAATSQNVIDDHQDEEDVDDQDDDDEDMIDADSLIDEYLNEEDEDEYYEDEEGEPTKVSNPSDLYESYYQFTARLAQQQQQEQEQQSNNNSQNSEREKALEAMKSQVAEKLNRIEESKLAKLKEKSEKSEENSKKQVTFNSEVSVKSFEKEDSKKVVETEPNLASAFSSVVVERGNSAPSGATTFQNQQEEPPKKVSRFKAMLAKK